MSRTLIGHVSKENEVTQEDLTSAQEFVVAELRDGSPDNLDTFKEVSDTMSGLVRDDDLAEAIANATRLYITAAYVDTAITTALDDYATDDDLAAAISNAIAPYVTTSIFTSALAAKADLVGGFIPTSQIPAIAFSTVVPVADQAAMLALTSSQVQPGDVAVRADGAGSFMLNNTNPAILGNWILLNAPADKLSSVNGQIGTVVLGYSDVGAASAAQGSKADSAVQPSAIGSVASHAVTEFASSSQGSKADSAIQPAGLTQAISDGTQVFLQTGTPTQSLGKPSIWLKPVGGSVVELWIGDGS